MKPLFFACLAAALGGAHLHAAIITVTTTNNATPSATDVSLLQALGRVQDGDEIRFNIPGAGPHYIVTPAQGYPLLTNSNFTLNGYSQPGSTPNSNSILAPNNARIDIVLDSRAGGYTPMKLALTAPNDDSGYEATDGAVLGFDGSKGVTIQGLGFLGARRVGPEASVSLKFIAFGRGASGQISGCWLGVDPDGKTVASADFGVTGYRYRGRDALLTTTNTILSDDVVIGVASKATNAVQQFNVLAGMAASPVVIEGDRARISGNFLTVLPDGLHDYNVALDPNLSGTFQGAIGIGRGGNNTVIGIDGDGVNDANERNVMGGMLPPPDGYPHLIEFYGLNPGTNIVVAGNYIGIGIDSSTRFTNGVPAFNGSGPAASYRIGSDFDGVSDSIEGNLIANNYPSSLFPASDFQEMPESLGFFTQLNPGASVSLRGNSLIDNFPFPTSPLRDGGQFWPSYYAKALLDPSAGVTPTLITVETVSGKRLLKGTVPITDPAVYNKTVVDLYIADPEGMTNGMAAQIPELPQGFVQGLSYRASFTEGSADDLDAQAGSFSFDISRVNIPAGSFITATANYTGTGSGTGDGGGEDGEAPQITGISKTDAGVTITWTGSGTPQSAPSVLGPWTDEQPTTATSFTAPITGPLQFFRLKAGDEPVGPTTISPVLTSPFSNALQL